MPKPLRREILQIGLPSQCRCFDEVVQRDAFPLGSVNVWKTATKRSVPDGI